MYCPKCAGEFREGITHCANCDVDLVAEPPRDDPFDDEETMAALLQDKDLHAVVVGSYASVRENQRALARERIPSVIAPEDETVNPQAGVHNRLYLLVDANDIERVQRHFSEKLARGLATEGLMLKGGGAAGAADAPDDSDTMPCPACGTPVSASVEECPDCGLTLAVADDGADHGADDSADDSADDEGADDEVRGE